MAPKRIMLKDLNDPLTCTLCGGYFIDATALVDCPHVFCRGCILRYFENCKQACPTCNVVYKKKNTSCFRPDPKLQAMVYKLVPGLYSREMQRRDDFYRSTGVRASSSCSDDSVLGDMMQDHEQWVSSHVGDQNQLFYSPDDSISLSLEYYQHCLDDTECADKVARVKPLSNGQITGGKSDVDKVEVVNNGQKCEVAAKEAANDRRFLQCPAAVTMSHLQKFLRMKFALSGEHRVDIIYEGEVLPASFSLMDVAYTFNWNRTKPMRFFYRIFTPLKIRPIKIINTSSANGSKQLQIVPVQQPEPPPETPKPPVQTIAENQDTNSQTYRNKEKLLANLQLQSRTKAQNNERMVRFLTPEPYEKPDGIRKKRSPEPNCVYEYQEPDEEEVKRFAEKRDREWALQKRLDEQESLHHVSKKRKKNKHSKNESVHKKRKLHAEITSNEVLIKEESLKLKVKLTPHNGHKHKHHRSSQSQTPEVVVTSPEISSKEKLLQMRAVRHKHVIGDEKPVAKSSPDVTTNKDVVTTATTTTTTGQKQPKTPEVERKVTFAEEPIKTADKPPVPPQIKIPAKSPDGMISGKTLRSDFSIKTTASKELGVKNQPTEQQAKNTVAAKAVPKVQSPKIETAKVPITKPESLKPVPKPVQLKHPLNNNNNSKGVAQNSFERKIANLKQQCTIEAKGPSSEKPEAQKPEQQTKKVCFNTEASKILNSQYQTGFTVSKVETGVKRKSESEESSNKDKRPSLEITLINPGSSSSAGETKPQTKRPPPATIPLERIKKTYSFKSGISIIPKLPERCDNIGALDLSKPAHRPLHNGTATTASPKPSPPQKPGAKPPQEKNVHMSNLQMLSKVALEYPALNKSNANKPKPQVPNLQTLKIPVPAKTSPNLAKLPKLNEINKNTFRMQNPQVRNMRPNQNQSIRNIPNPSLLVSKQTQNRLNSIGGTNSSAPQTPAAPAESKESRVKTPPSGVAAASTEGGGVQVTAAAGTETKKDASSVASVESGGSGSKESVVPKAEVNGGGGN